MANTIPVNIESQSSPPESEIRATQVIDKSRIKANRAIQRTELPTEIDRAEMARRLDVEKLEIEGLSLRPNQLTAIQKLRKFLLETDDDAGYFVQPTGAGKTFTFGLIAKLVGVKALVLVPTVQLVEQTKSEFISGLGYTEDEIGIIEPGKDIPQGKKVIISTYASHVSRLKHKKDKDGRVTRGPDIQYKQAVASNPLVICDEAHRALGDKTSSAIGVTEGEEKAQQEALENLQTHTSSKSIKLGFTATPDLSQKNVGKCFRNLIAKEKLTDLQEAGFLVPYRTHAFRLNVEKGEITDKTTLNEEGEILRKHDVYGKIIQRWEEIHTEERTPANTKPLRTIVFCANTNECEEWAKEAEGRGIKCQLVTYKQGKIVEESKKNLLDGKIDMIVTVNKLAEGFDCRPINCVILARATTSRARIIQPAGRGLRAQNEEEDKIYGQKKLCHIIQPKFKTGGMKGSNKGDGGGFINRTEGGEGYLKSDGEETFLFDEIIQEEEGKSGEVEGNRENTKIKYLEFDENGVAEIIIEGQKRAIVIPEVYMQNLPYIEADDLLEADSQQKVPTLEAIELNSNRSRFGKIPIGLAYLKTTVDALIRKEYMHKLHLSEEGEGIFVDPDGTIREKRLIGVEVISTNYLRKHFPEFIAEDLSHEALIRLLAAHGIQRATLSKGMKVVEQTERGTQSIYFKEDIERLEENLTKPDADKLSTKLSFSVPENKDSDVAFIIHFGNDKNLELLSFCKMKDIKTLIKNIQEAVDSQKDDQNALRFLREKLEDYVERLSQYGMISSKGAKMHEKIVEEKVLDPLYDIIDRIGRKLAA